MSESQLDKSMALPNGRTCGDCHFYEGKCSKIYGAEAGSASCDFAPSRFLRDRAKMEAENTELAAENERLREEIRKALVFLDSPRWEPLRAAQILHDATK